MYRVSWSTEVLERVCCWQGATSVSVFSSNRPWCWGALKVGLHNFSRDLIRFPQFSFDISLVPTQKCGFYWKKPESPPFSAEIRKHSLGCLNVVWMSSLGVLLCRTALGCCHSGRWWRKLPGSHLEAFGDFQPPHLWLYAAEEAVTQGRFAARVDCCLHLNCAWER